MTSTLTITEWTHPSKEISMPRHIQTKSLRASGRPVVEAKAYKALIQELTQQRGPEGLPWTLSASGVPMRNRKAPKSTAKIDGTLSCFF